MTRYRITTCLCDDDECQCLHAVVLPGGWTSTRWPFLDDLEGLDELRAEVEAKAAELRAAGHEVTVDDWPGFDDA